MASSTTPVNNPPNTLINETATHDYMRQFADYLDNGIDFTELSEIRQLDIYLQNCYHRVRDLVDSLRIKIDDQNEQSQSQLENQTMLINALIQAKTIGDKKMQLSQQMLDATERQSKQLKMAYQKCIESTHQQTSSLDNNPNDIDSDNEYDSESSPHRSLSTKASTSSLWKRKPTTATINLKRKCVIISESNNNEISLINQRDRKKTTQRNLNTSIINNNNANGKKLKLNNESSTTQSDETTYCLCSQLSYGSMILCDNKSCEIKWFHFNCVHLTTKPKGKWFCPNCRENRI